MARAQPSRGSTAAAAQSDDRQYDPNKSLAEQSLVIGLMQAGGKWLGSAIQEAASSGYSGSAAPAAAPSRGSSGASSTREYKADLVCTSAPSSRNILGKEQIAASFTCRSSDKNACKEQVKQEIKSKYGGSEGWACEKILGPKYAGKTGSFIRVR